MAGFNRKRATYCAWCGEGIYSNSDGVLARVKAADDIGPGANFHPCHVGECVATFASVMRSNGYNVNYKGETR